MLTCLHNAWAPPWAQWCTQNLQQNNIRFHSKTATIIFAKGSSWPLHIHYLRCGNSWIFTCEKPEGPSWLKLCKVQWSLAIKDWWSFTSEYSTVHRPTKSLAWDGFNLCLTITMSCSEQQWLKWWISNLSTNSEPHNIMNVLGSASRQMFLVTRLILQSILLSENSLILSQCN